MSHNREFSKGASGKEVLKMVEINLVIIAGFCVFKYYRSASKIEVV